MTNWARLAWRIPDSMRQIHSISSSAGLAVDLLISLEDVLGIFFFNYHLFFFLSTLSLVSCSSFVEFVEFRFRLLLSVFSSLTSLLPYPSLPLSFPQSSSSQHTRNSRKTEDAVRPLPVTLKQLYTGLTKKLRVRRQRICKECKGSGAKGDVLPDKCGDCDGSGIKVNIIRRGPMIQQSQSVCPTCKGEGRIIPEGQKCGGCNGNRVLSPLLGPPVTSPPSAAIASSSSSSRPQPHSHSLDGRGSQDLGSGGDERNAVRPTYPLSRRV